MPDFLYIHIPFCIRKCIYCDFLSVPYDESFAKKYIDALCKELHLKKDSAKIINHPHPNPPPSRGRVLVETPQQATGNIELKTIYIGGGTPSLLPDECFRQLFRCLRNNFNFSPSIEITVEANPGTVNELKINLLLSLGINRLSIGVQSFNNNELRILGRVHTSGDAARSIELIRKAGVDNFSIDLMYGIPGQTMDSWHESLSTAVELSPAHISAYELTPEENTPLYKLLKSNEPVPQHKRETSYTSPPKKSPPPCPSPIDGEGNIINCKSPPLAKGGKGGFSNKIKMPDEELILEMYNHAIDYLASFGYEHYEISNFAFSEFGEVHPHLNPPPSMGREILTNANKCSPSTGGRGLGGGGVPLTVFKCLHNLNYWNRGEYIGAGAGAHSFVNGLRSKNTKDINKYIEDLNSGIIPEIESTKLTPVEAIKEFIFLGLRKTEGININELTSRVSRHQFCHSALDAESRVITYANPLDSCFRRNDKKVRNDTSDYKSGIKRIFLNKPEEFGLNVLDACRELVDEGYLTIEGNYLRLTRKGIVISNTIIVRMFERLKLD